MDDMPLKAAIEQAIAMHAEMLPQLPSVLRKFYDELKKEKFTDAECLSLLRQEMRCIFNNGGM